MGSNASTQSNIVNSNTVNESITKVISDVTNSISASSTSYQNINIKSDGLVLMGDFKVRQIADVGLKALLNSDVKVMSDISNQLTTKIKNDLDSKMKQANEQLNIGQVNVGVINTALNTNIKTLVDQSIKTSISNMVSSVSASNQVQTISFKNDTIYGNVDLSQEGIVKNISENISKTLETTIAKTISDSDTSNSIKNAVEQFNKGIDVFAIAGMVVIGIGLVLCITLVVKYATGSTAAAVAANPALMNAAAVAATGAAAVAATAAASSKIGGDDTSDISEGDISDDISGDISDDDTSDDRYISGGGVIDFFKTYKYSLLGIFLLLIIAVMVVLVAVNNTSAKKNLLLSNPLTSKYVDVSKKW